MKLFRRTAGLRKILVILAALSFFTCTAYADPSNYQFDDLAGTSGISHQWVILNSLSDGANTFGANHVVSMEVSADFFTSDSQRENVEVVNGTPDENTIANRNASALYFILGEGDGTYTFSFRSPTNINQAEAEAVGVNINFGSDTGAIRSRYHTEKVAHAARVDSDGQFWVDYTFTFAPLQGSSSKYDTVREYFAFTLNPEATPSQTKQIPVVIANVNKESALEEKLELRMALRDARNNGNIVAYKHDTWNALDKKTTDSDQWILVPVDDINNISKINYYLTTELVNHTSYRYAAEDLNEKWIFPTYWKFDLPRYVGTNNITSKFKLDEMSHAAPGLVSIYNRPYDMAEQNKRPFGNGFYCIDYTSEGFWELVFNNNVIFCKQIGSPYEYGTDSTYNNIEITAFEPNPAGQSFYEDVAEKTGSSKTISPVTSFTQSSVTRESPTSLALEYFTIDHAIPGSLRSDTVEGMLPLHITFNIPVKKIQDYEWWNDMVDEWRNSGKINEAFAKNLAIYAMVDDKNIWNMSQELTKHGVYDSQVKIFLDEDRGSVTYDNYKGVVTVSFMILLMNGTRDGERPEMSIVEDVSNTATQKYIAIRDGADDDSWKVQFFIAPADYKINDEDDDDDNKNNNTDNLESSGGGGGGGCDTGAGFLFVIISGLALLALNKKYKQEA